MPGAPFEFISDSILRTNLTIVLLHIMDLLTHAERYQDIRRSSFRKTAIIYTATIIEALLLWLLKQDLGKKRKLRLKNEWKYKDIHLIHQLSDDPPRQIIWVIRKGFSKYRLNLRVL